MRRSLFAAVLVLSALPALAGAVAAQDPVTLQGRVLDDATGTPVPGVVVRIPDARRFTLTDPDGVFRFPDLPPGSYRIQAMALGFYDHAVEFGVDGEREVVLRLERRPIELDEIVVGTGSYLDDMATSRASAMRSFWRIFDRDDILDSDTDDPIEFLDEAAGLVLRPCRGIGADSSRMCLIAPAPLQSGQGRWLEFPSRAVDNPSRPSRRMTLLERMRSESSSGVWRSRARIGDSYRRASVYLDDRPLPGSLDGLAEYSMRDIERIETYGVRGERQIRLYTEGYLRMVELGQIRPDFSVPPLDRYVPTWIEDDRDPRRQR